MKGNWKELVSPSHLKNTYSTSHYETDNPMKDQPAFQLTLNKNERTVGQVLIEQHSENLSRQGAPMTPAKSSPASAAWAQWQIISAVSPEASKKSWIPMIQATSFTKWWDVTDAKTSAARAL